MELGDVQLRDRIFRRGGGRSGVRERHWLEDEDNNILISVKKAHKAINKSNCLLIEWPHRPAEVGETVGPRLECIEAPSICVFHANDGTQAQQAVATTPGWLRCMPQFLRFLWGILRAQQMVDDQAR